MKNILCYLFLIVGSFNKILGFKTNGFESELPHVFDNINDYKEGSGDFLKNKNINFPFDYNRDQGIVRTGYSKFGFDDGNPDVYGNIQRPCQSYDTFCIRKFFADHSKCRISGRSVPNPFYRRQGNINYAAANISAILVDAEYRGLDNARVEEFYIDTVTDNLVIAFTFNAISYFGNNTNVKFYLRGREPEVHQGPVALAYGQLTITMVIPGLKDLRPDRAEITAYIDNPILPFVFSPSIPASSNPEVVAMAVYLVTVGVPVDNLEQLATESAFFSGNYLQYNICDFGLKYL